ncbi:MAG: hypothetical protein ACR2OO_03565, partial [Thermomicrobiales bacterium]
MVGRFRRNPALAIPAVLLVGFGVPVVSGAPTKGLGKLWTAMGVAFVLGSVRSFAAPLAWLGRRLFTGRGLGRGTRIAPSPGVVPLLSLPPSTPPSPPPPPP